MLNPFMQDAVKTEILKLLDNQIIYPFSDSQWVSLVHVSPKKVGFMVVENKHKELIHTRLPTKVRVCIDYQKLNAATGKDHFTLPFIDQMLDRLAGHECYYFWTSTQDTIRSPAEDQEMTMFTCTFGTFGYQRMLFGLCNSPATFQRCMLSLFSDMVECFLEIFMDDFSIYRDSFDQCLHHLELVLQRCKEKNLTLNRKNFHFMV